MDKYTILMVHNQYQLPGGEDLGFKTEVKMLKEKGHKVIEYIRHNDEIKEYSLLQKLKFPLEMIWSSKTYKEISEIIKKEKPQIAHFHNTFPLVSPSAYYACKDNNIPVLQLLNNYRLICPGGFLLRDNKICEDCIKYGLQESIKHKCYKNSFPLTVSLASMLKFHRLKNTWFTKIDKYILLSEFSKNKYIEAGFPEEKFVVKSNFIEKDPGKREHSGNYVLFFGRLSPEKGPHIFLEAVNYLKNTNIIFKIVGSGPMEKELKKYATDNNLNNVEFISHVPNEKVFDLIKNSKFTVIPMMWYEFLPRVLIETLACGVPIITCNVGVMADIVKDNIHGLHFNLGDSKDLAEKISYLSKNEEKIKIFSQNARELYEKNYTKEINYKKLMDIYQNVISKK